MLSIDLSKESKYLFSLPIVFLAKERKVANFEIGIFLEWLWIFSKSEFDQDAILDGDLYLSRI